MLFRKFPWHETPDGCYHADDLNFQKLSTVQNALGPGTPTIASAATIAPTTLHTLVTGTVQVVTVTPPVSGDHLLFLTFTNAAPGAFTTAGNIITAYQPIQNRPIGMLYVAALNKYYQLAVV
jgi:hypothetical protein